jgi:hypothetical protein
MPELNVYGNDFVKVRSDTVGTATAMSGVGTVSGAGTAVQLPDIALDNGAFVKSIAANTGLLYVGNVAGTVSSANGFELSAGNVAFFNVDNLNQIFVNASVGTSIYCWMKA